MADNPLAGLKASLRGELIIGMTRTCSSPPASGAGTATGAGVHFYKSIFVRSSLIGPTTAALLMRLSSLGSRASFVIKGIHRLSIWRSALMFNSRGFYMSARKVPGDIIPHWLLPGSDQHHAGSLYPRRAACDTAGKLHRPDCRTAAKPGRGLLDLRVRQPDSIQGHTARGTNRISALDWQNLDV